MKDKQLDLNVLSEKKEYDLNEGIKKLYELNWKKGFFEKQSCGIQCTE